VTAAAPRAGYGEAGGAPPPAWGALAGLGAVKLLIHLALAGRYGYFRDELYFLDCGRRLDWGYVDHAPLVALWAKLALLLGGSLPALRLFPALAGALLVVLTGLLAWRLGGGRFAQALAALAVLAAPINLGIDSILSMNAFEPLFWVGCIYALVRIIQTGAPRLWIAVGVLLGFGLLNKHSTIFFAVAVAAALLLSPERRALRTRWPWLGAAAAFLVFLPNLVWQARHDFATLEDLRNVARTGKNIVLGPLDFIGQQIVILHPILFPLWLGGLLFLLFGRRGRYRTLGWLYLVLFVLMFAMKGKNYYLAPIYPMLFAAGSVALEAGLARLRLTRDRLWPKAAIVALVATAGALTAPLVLPILPPERFVAYERSLGFAPPKTEVRHEGPLPQLFGDQFGWEEMVAEVGSIYNALTPEERARTAILANNYGEAGAINQFGPKYGLPRAICAHQTHFLWGPRDFRGDQAIVLQMSREDLQTVCASVEEVGAHFHPWGMAEENNPIYLCRGLTTSLPDLWPRLKHWN
jgi:hypothetical protein